MKVNHFLALLCGFLLFLAGTLEAKNFYNDIFLATVTGIHEKKQLSSTTHEASITFYKMLQEKAAKPLKSLTEQEIKHLIALLSIQEQEAIYNNFKREDKKIAICGLRKQFWDIKNNMSLAAFLDSIVFLIMKGQGLEDIQPIIKKEHKNIGEFKKTTSFSLVFAAKFKKFFNRLVDQVPPSIQQEILELIQSPEIEKYRSPGAKISALVTILSTRLIANQDYLKNTNGWII